MPDKAIALRAIVFDEKSSSPFEIYLPNASSHYLSASPRCLSGRGKQRVDTLSLMLSHL